MTKIEPDVVEVTQADREAAADFLDVLGFPHLRQLVDGKSGWKDLNSEKALTLIARHRLAALSTLPVSPGSGLADELERIRDWRAERIAADDHIGWQAASIAMSEAVHDNLSAILAALRQPSPTAPLTGEQERTEAPGSFNEGVEADDWFKRHADRRNPKAFINTLPSYFASECADAIINGSLSHSPLVDRVVGQEGQANG